MAGWRVGFIVGNEKLVGALKRIKSWLDYGMFAPIQIAELEDGHITNYTQGAFTDLCRGPHLMTTAPIKAIKLTSVAGAYWRGHEDRKMLTRIYGITFPKKKMLDEYLVLLEEAKKRDHRKNNEMWADSKEMIKMRIYLDSKVNLPEPEFVQLDKLLLEKAVKAVEDNLTEPDFDVTALADAMNMSRSTLTRKLKAITGRTPLDFIRNIKMKHARHMLEDKDKSVTEVAATLGYFNRKYFTTCFKEEFGMTPSEFQKSQHEE
jgi:AraC-like DNA-binding protein